MDLDSPAAVTLLVQRLADRGGDDNEAVELLLPMLYNELHGIADRIMRGERKDHTLQPTALVHEAYLHLVDAENLRWNDRAHFLALAARVMRRILVDHARRVGAAKRAGDLQKVTLTDDVAISPDRQLELLALDQAMTRLSDLDERVGQVAEMRLFGGLTVRDTAEALKVSARTVDGDWSMARLWLSRELGNGHGPADRLQP
jgi:RNA polymerase sigma factor (TIGR02999 family)